MSCNIRVCRMLSKIVSRSELITGRDRRNVSDRNSISKHHHNGNNQLAHILDGLRHELGQLMLQSLALRLALRQTRLGHIPVPPKTQTLK